VSRPNIFLIIDKAAWSVFAFWSVTSSGPCVELLEEIDPLVGARPLLLHASTLTVQHDSGRVSSVTVESLSALARAGSESLAGSKEQALRYALPIVVMPKDCMPYLLEMKV
jgi:hypothetical protein